MDKQTAFLHGKIVAICEAIRSEKIGVIAGSRILNSLRFKLSEENDEDFMFFAGIDSETDYLPVDWERKNWSKDSLKEKDKEIAEIETFYKKSVISACENLIKRFDIKNY